MTQDNWIETRLQVTEEMVAAAVRIRPLIDPVWLLSNFYDGPEAYAASLAPFSPPQRMVWAMIWYLNETFNGGHDQFYSNSTGAVWADALEGFRHAGMGDVADILATSVERLGGNPSQDRDERTDAIDQLDPSFGDLDERLFAIGRARPLEADMLKFAKANAPAFVFDGVVKTPKLPG